MNDLPLARLAGVLLPFLLVALFGFGPLVEIWYPLGHVGINLNSQLHIVGVFPGGAAEAAGIKAGDRINPAQFWPRRRQYDPFVYYFPPAGARVELPIVRGSTHKTVTATTRESDLESVYRIGSAVSTIFQLVALGIAAWLVIARPSVMTWSFYLLLLGLNYQNGQNSAEFLSPLGYWWVVAGGMLCIAMQALWVFVLVFAIRIPNNHVARWMVVAQKAAIVVLCLELVLQLYPTVSWTFFGSLAPNLSAFTQVLLYLVCITAFVALIQNFVQSDGKDRHRMAWIIVGLGVWCAATLLVWAVHDNLPFYEGYTLTQVFVVVQSVAIILVVYGLMRSRVVDVSFVLSRAVVVSLLTGSVVLIFALLDWLFNKRLEATRLGALSEFIAAIVLGIWLDRLHKKADLFVDRLFFRARYLAERRLEKAAHAVVHSDSVDVIREFLVDEPYTILGLGSAAVFQPNEVGDWECMRSFGWDSGCATGLSKHDTLVMHVEAEQAPLRVSEIRWTVSDVPSGVAHPVLAVPVLARRRVLAIALYGEHTNGADLDGDEIRAIGGVADAAGAAFDHVEADQLRREMESLRRELGQRA
ncbi:MAG: hypothetical protein JO322_16390 [Candidatus Eremiobacteraeota bacterium]|nr:hypothetical protein [Candidatus Eremiobacteraeota bacterium]